MSTKTHMERAKFAANGVIFEEGDEADRAYLICSGKAEIRKGVLTEFPQKLAVRAKGEIIGEMGLFDNQPRMASAIALEDTEVIPIPREEFLSRIEAMDPVMRNVILLMVSRMREMANLVMERKKDNYWID